MTLYNYKCDEGLFNSDSNSPLQKFITWWLLPNIITTEVIGILFSVPRENWKEKTKSTIFRYYMFGTCLGQVLKCIKQN